MEKVEEQDNMKHGFYLPNIAKAKIIIDKYNKIKTK